MVSSFSQLINRKLIGKVVETLPANLAAIFELVYNGGSMLHPETDFDFEEMTATSDAVVPVIKKGTPAIPLGNESTTIKRLSPDPIEISRDLNAWEMNKLKTYNDASRQAQVTKFVEYLTKRIFNTRVAMASKSLTGTVSWYRREQGGMLQQQTQTYFSVLTASGLFTGSWTASTKPSVVIQDLNYIIQEQQDLGHGMNPVFYAGKKAFRILQDIANAQTNSNGLLYNISPMMINFGGFIINNQDFRYHDLANNGSVSIQSVLAEGEILCLDQAPGNFREYALPIDDFKADLRPIPLYIDSRIKEDPSILQIVAKANPLFVPTKNTITKVTAAS